MFNKGRYKTLIGNLTVFKNMYETDVIKKKGTVIDIDKVGIHGHSGGGFMSTAAMCQYPDFFKVAVSCAGNHASPAI